MAGKGQLGGRGEDAGMGGAGALLREVDEYRFAVTQFGGDALAVGGIHRAGVDHAEGIAELAVGIGENAQHCHVDGHVPDATYVR